MKRFRFPLKPVAVLRSHREVRAREAYGAAVQQHAIVQEEVRRIGVRMRALEAALSNGRTTSFRAAEAALLLSDYRRERDAEAAADQRLIVAAEAMNKARLAYLEAHRELEIINRLEVKARDVYRLETNRAEQVEMDELAGQKRQQPFSVNL